MGLIGGLGSFFALLAGEPLVESSFPADWELKTKPYSGDATLPADADGKGSKGKKGKGGKAADPVLELTPAERKRLIERGASELLILLQREGRLVDFLEQEIDEYDDADIGAAVREIHKGCRKVLTEHFTVRPVFKDAEEEDEVEVKKGFNPEEIRLVGNVKGDPPFKGTLQHHGWKLDKISMPQVGEDVDTTVLAPAEVEL